MQSAAPFLRLPAFQVVTEEMLDRFEQKRAKPAAVAVGLLEPVFLQDHDKKILGEILRILVRVASPADEGKDGPPIRSAKLVQRLARFRLAAVKFGAN